MLKTGALKVEVWGEGTVRVLYGSPGSAASPPPQSLAVNQARPNTHFKLADDMTEITLRTSKLEVHVNKTSGQVTFKNPAGDVILAEVLTDAHLLTPTQDGAGNYQAIGTFAPKPGERFFGLGQHQNGELPYGSGIELMQSNPGESSVPLLVSSGGYGILWDNPSITDVGLGSEVSFSSEVAPVIDYYFIAGGADEVVAGYRALTGQAPLFGKWAFGYWQSKDRYSSQQELLSVASTYRSKKVPIDNIVQDWQYWEGYPIGSHQFNDSYPDPAGMFKTLRDSGFHSMISVWPVFGAGSVNYDALKAAGALMTPALSDGMSWCYDPFKADGRALYWEQMNKALFSKGVDAWWLDATEPELNSRFGEFRDFQTAMGKGAGVANAYPLMTTTAVHDGQRAATSEKRVFILTRSAYAGQQRNGATTWSGDVTSDWDTLKRQVPAGLNFSLSGLPYWTTDTGGYTGGVGSPGFTELFERWLQFSAFCPIFRTHGQGEDRNLYAFGPEAQTVLQGVDNLRYRLLPYIYSTAWMVTNRSYTMMRALYFDFASDNYASNTADQFMFGPAFLVNPVTTPGATSRTVYLPATATWYDFWTGATSQGGSSVDAAAPIDHIPLFVRAGSIVPLGPLLQYSTEKPADPIELRVYRGADGSFTLYEDENDNYNYEKGAFTTIPLTYREAQKKLTIGARCGSFPGMLTTRTFRVVFVSPQHGVGPAESAVVDQIVAYEGAAVEVAAP